MNSSFLYHAWGLYTHKCTHEEYKGNTIILHVEAKDREKECPKCGHRHLVKNVFRIRDFIGLPIGGKKVIIRRKSNATNARTRIVITTVKRRYLLQQAVVVIPTVSQNT